MKILMFFRSLLYRIGIDSCDLCFWRLFTRKGGHHWGYIKVCNKCNTRLEQSYEAYMAKAILEGKV